MVYIYSSLWLIWVGQIQYQHWVQSQVGGRENYTVSDSVLGQSLIPFLNNHGRRRRKILGVFVCATRRSRRLPGVLSVAYRCRWLGRVRTLAITGMLRYRMLFSVLLLSDNSFWRWIALYTLITLFLGNNITYNQAPLVSSEPSYGLNLNGRVVSAVAFWHRITCFIRFFGARFKGGSIYNIHRTSFLWFLDNYIYFFPCKRPSNFFLSLNNACHVKLDDVFSKPSWSSSSSLGCYCARRSTNGFEISSPVENDPSMVSLALYPGYMILSCIGSSLSSTPR